MKALKSEGVQILIIGIVICAIASKINLSDTIITIFATGFVALTGGKIIRSNIQSSKGQYYDEEEKTLKTAKHE